MGIEYRLPGRLEVLSDGVPVDLGSQRQRALLALLLANAGTVLSTDRILEELRLEATEMRVEADLRLGLSGEIVPELKGLVRQHPLRDRFVASLMLALYRCGRTAEALRAYAAFRERLVAEVGVDPSRSIRELEQQILTDDDALLIDRGTAAATNEPRTRLTVRGYELREVLGRGAFGAVYRAYQPIVGREVAIKVIAPEFADDPKFIRRFEAEAQIVAGLEHPRIVPLYNYWREPRSAYLVMRLIGNNSLADTLADGALPPARAASFVVRTCVIAFRGRIRGDPCGLRSKAPSVGVSSTGSRWSPTGALVWMLLDCPGAGCWPLCTRLSDPLAVVGQVAGGSIRSMVPTRSMDRSNEAMRLTPELSAQATR